jgi:integrase/recombinase XerD
LSDAEIVVITGIRGHHYSHVKRSPFASDFEGFRGWLVAADYTPHVIRQHVIRLDLILREMGKTANATCAIAQLDAAFGKHNVPPSGLVLFRGTQRQYQLYLASHGRLTIPTVANRFAALRDRYHQELVEVRGFAISTLKHHDATVADFLARGLRPRQHLRHISRSDIERYIALKSTENSRQSLQHTVAALRAFLCYCYDHGQTSSRRDIIDTPRAYRGELLPRALEWSAIQRLLRSIDRRTSTGERDYAILHLMAHYGLRPSEIVSLRLDSISWADNTLKVEQRKTRSMLVLPLAVATVKVLCRYLERVRGDDVSKYAELFLRTHCPYRALRNSAICEMFSRRAQECGLGRREYTAYSLRHEFAMRLLTRGVGVKAIGDVLGHRDLESTCVYLRLDIHSLRHVALPVPRTARQAGAPHG